jgi:DNA primase
MSAIDEVKARLDIVEVIGAYVKLTRSGRSYKGLSPFQSERTPSFFVFPDSQTYKDFSSGEQGDIFKFMMKKEGWSFVEALRELAHRAGVQLEERTEDQKKSQDHETRLREACAQAADYFHRLFLSAPQAEHCRKYVKETRSLSEKTIVDWQIGYGLMDYQALSTYLGAKGFVAQELIDAGLVIENDEGRRYDRFRGRLMIPIRDEKGRVIGFGSRSLDGSEPKYMNSPQTAIFDKGRLLFGLDKARGPIRNEKLSVLVEGYMDVIGTHQAGFTNVVAGMGTSLTEDQFKQLKKLADRIVLALDADAAGNRAVLRGVDVARGALEHDDNVVLDGRGVIRHESKLRADIRVALLPDGRDPDEVVLEAPDVWRAAIANARPVVEHVIAIALEKYDANDPKGKSEAVKAVAPILQDLSDPVQRDFYIQQLARKLQLSARAVTQAVNLNLAQKPNRNANAPAAPNTGTQLAMARPPQPPDGPSAEASNTTPTQIAKGVNLEIHLLSILAQKPDLLMDANVVLTRHNLEVLGDKDFVNPALQMGFQQLSRAAMGQALPEANTNGGDDARDDWLTIVADYKSAGDYSLSTSPGDAPDELFLREEVIRTVLRLREENLRRDHEALCFMIEESQTNVHPTHPTHQTDPTDENAVSNTEDGVSATTLGLYNLKLQQISTQRFRAQKALRLRSALTVG